SAQRQQMKTCLPVARRTNWIAATNPGTGLFFANASRSHSQSAHLLLSRLSMRHVRWQTLMFRCITAQVRHIPVRRFRRSLNDFHITTELIYLLLKPVKVHPRRMICHCLMHRPNFIADLLKKYASIVIITSHTSSLTHCLTEYHSCHEQRQWRPW